MCMLPFPFHVGRLFGPRIISLVLGHECFDRGAEETACAGTFKLLQGPRTLEKNRTGRLNHEHRESQVSRVVR